mgnify:CR=1 FL=1
MAPPRVSSNHCQNSRSAGTTAGVFDSAARSSNATVEAVHKALRERSVPTRYHVIPGITHYGVYREGFEEATRVELEWFDRHLKTVAQ